MSTFSALLKDAMTARGITSVTLAGRIGFSREAVQDWRSGRSQPSRYSTVSELARILDAPGLVQCLQRPCKACGQMFFGADIRSLYCTANCSQRYHGKARTSRTVTVVTHELARHRIAVAAFCGGCQPFGLCIDASCPLRPVSPLPLKERVAA